jgi:hypothetical protein
MNDTSKYLGIQTKADTNIVIDMDKDIDIDRGRDVTKTERQRDRETERHVNMIASVNGHAKVCIRRHMLEHGCAHSHA